MKSGCCSHAAHHPAATLADAHIDPVCGMNVSADSPHVAEHEDKQYYLCSAGCRKKFLAMPGQYLNQGAAAKPHAQHPTHASSQAVYIRIAALVRPRARSSRAWPSSISVTIIGDRQRTASAQCSRCDRNTITLWREADEPITVSRYLWPLLTLDHYP